MRAARECGFPRRSKRDRMLHRSVFVRHDVGGAGWKVEGLPRTHPMYDMGTATIEELARLWIILATGE